MQCVNNTHCNKATENCNFTLLSSKILLGYQTKEILTISPSNSIRTSGGDFSIFSEGGVRRRTLAYLEVEEQNKNQMRESDKSAF